MALGIKKYLFGTLLISLAATAGVVVSCSPTGRSAASRRSVEPIFDTTGVALPEGPDLGATAPQADTVASVSAGDAAVDSLPATDTLPGGLPVRDSLAAALDSLPSAIRDSILRASGDSLRVPVADSALAARTTDTISRSRRTRPFLEAPVVGKANDSLVYDVRRRLIFHYNQGDLTYEENHLMADYIIVNAATKEIYGTGVADTAGVVSRPEFIQGGATYTMDTLRYNLDSKKALVQGVATKDGEGFMTGRRMKKMPDNTINIDGAKYTTCDRVDHPHFYIAMTKAKTIPGKKIITGPAYFVMEDVPIYFLGIPGGFFPISTGPTAGLIMPTYGEESNRGFYLRGGGYYFTFGEHLDLRLTADLYTLGSWGVNAASNYVWRYKFNGGFSATYNNLIVGDKNSPNYSKSNTFSVTWRHTQDPKSNPNQNFSANVNFSTSGQKQMATTSLQDHLNTNTSSSVQYSRRWQVGQSTVNLTTQFNLNANSRDTALNITLPNISLSVSSFAPFKRKAAAGKQRWYEKITMSYNMQAQNTTGTVKEYELFSKKTLRGLQNGVTHSIPVQTSFNLFNYINFSPSFNYRESWSFKRQMRGWDPNGGNGSGAAMNTTDPSRDDYIAPEFGFFRSYGWNVAGSFSTKIYGQFEVKRKPGETGWLQAFRHVMTPTVSFSYAPDFRHPRYGMWEHVQTDASGRYTGYNPNQGYGVISPAGPNASINFSLANQLELKVKGRRDTAEMKKVKVIEQLSIGSSYNFLADSMNLNTFPISLRTGEIFKGFAIQLNATWDPYQWVQVGNAMKRTRHFSIGKGKFGRITQTGWSFGKTFNSRNSASPAPGSMQGQYIDPNLLYDPYNFSNGLDPALRRQYMAAGWYDFTIPWSFTFNYNVSYSNTTSLKPQIKQSLSFNGNVTLTEKWGFNFNSGYDFTRRKISHMQVNLTRDLHCWEMTFSWVPMGYTKMYSFHIGIKSGMLRDIKYDKSSNMYDNMMR